MRRNHLTYRVAITAIVLLALVVPGCQTSPTEPEITVEELFTHLNIALGATSTGSGAFNRHTNAGQSGLFQEEPLDRDFQILGPNTDVLSPQWPIIQDLPINAFWSGDDMVLQWPGLSPPMWPEFDVAGGTRFGNTWIGYPAGGNPNNWVAQHTEWVRYPGEATGTTFPLLEKMEAAEPCNDCPVAQWIAGPSRHTPNNPQYRRRTEKKWFRWGDMTPWVWPEDELPPAPTGPPELTEIHVFVTNVSATLEGGSTIDFEDEVGDVELFTLVGMNHQIADAAVPQGQVASVTITVDPAQSWVRADGDVADLNFNDPAITVQSPFEVGNTGPTTATITIDLDASMSWNEADGSWTISPVIVITVVDG